MPKVKSDDTNQEAVREKMLEQLKKIVSKKLSSTLGNEEIESSISFAEDYESVTDVISTGYANLDEIITPLHLKKHGKAGVPCGYLCEFFGPNAGGKSSLCLKLAASVQKDNGYVLWQDAEEGFQSDWAKIHGVDTSKLVLNHNPGTNAETYLELLKTQVESGLFRLAVVDSLAGLVPKASLETALEDNERLGLKARLMSRSLPMIVQAAKKGNCAVIFINQVRKDPGIKYGNPEVTPGGEALKFYASLRIRLNQVAGKDNRGIIKGDEEIGIRCNTLIVKSRFGPPYKETVIPIYYTEEKPHPLDMLLDLGLSNKLIKSRTYKGETSFSFEPNLIKLSSLDDIKDKMIKNECLIKELSEKIEKIRSLDPDIKSYILSLGEKEKQE